MSRAYLFQIFEEITESRILGEKEIVHFSLTDYSICINYQAFPEKVHLKEHKLLYTRYHLLVKNCSERRS